MNEERLKLTGRLHEARRKLKELELCAAGDIRQIRSVADPYEDDMLSIKSDELVLIANRFRSAQEEMRTTTKTISELEEALGL